MWFRVRELDTAERYEIWDFLERNMQERRGEGVSGYLRMPHVSISSQTCHVDPLHSGRRCLCRAAQHLVVNSVLFPNELQAEDSWKDSISHSESFSFPFLEPNDSASPVRRHSTGEKQATAAPNTSEGAGRTNTNPSSDELGREVWRNTTSFPLHRKLSVVVC